MICICFCLRPGAFASRAISNLQKLSREGHTLTLFRVNSIWWTTLWSISLVPESSRCGCSPGGKEDLAEINLNGLFARFVRNHDLFWHILPPFVYCFCFYQFRLAASRNLALLARGLITNSTFSAVMGFLLIMHSSASSP